MNKTTAPQSRPAGEQASLRQVTRGLALGTLALAAAAGVQAQSSSVSIYGSIDQYFNHMSSSSGAHINALQDGKDLRSRLGFRGSEDLGAGLKASFWLEMGLQPDTGKNASVWGNGGVDNQLFFNRRSTVSLSNQWGELRLGRDYTVNFNVSGKFDAFGANGFGNGSNLYANKKIGRAHV